MLSIYYMSFIYTYASYIYIYTGCWFDFIFYFSMYWEFHHPNWLFFRGIGLNHQADHILQPGHRGESRRGKGGKGHCPRGKSVGKQQEILGRYWNYRFYWDRFGFFRKKKCLFRHFSAEWSPNDEGFRAPKRNKEWSTMLIDVDCICCNRLARLLGVLFPLGERRLAVTSQGIHVCRTTLNLMV